MHKIMTEIMYTHNCFHLDAHEIWAITEQPSHLNIGDHYHDDCDCEFKQVFMGSGEFTFPALAIYMPGTDQIERLVQLDGDKIYLLKKVDSSIDQPSTECLEDTGLPAYVS